MIVQRFTFKLRELPARLPDGWTPLAVESDPEAGAVWIWAWTVNVGAGTYREGSDE